jgi:hypothetical protein
MDMFEALTDIKRLGEYQIKQVTPILARREIKFVNYGESKYFKNLQSTYFDPTQGI